MYKALVVVDMQNDFIDGALGTDEAVAIVPGVARRIAESRGELIVFTRDTHGEDYLDTPEGRKLPVVHCVEGTSGWELRTDVIKAWRDNRDTLVLDDDGKVVNKADGCEDCTVVPDAGQPSCTATVFDKPVFGSVDLVEFLKGRAAAGEVESIELVGLCTDICVVSNAIMLKNTMPDVPVAVNAPLCAGVTPTSHTEALNTMKMCQVDIIE